METEMKNEENKTESYETKTQFNIYHIPISDPITIQIPVYYQEQSKNF
jgi:hypothetical protein